MTTRARKKCSVLFGIVLVLGLIAPASAGDFSTAMNHVFSSNTYFAAGVYYFEVGFYYDSLGIDPWPAWDTALQNISSAVESAYNGYLSASNGYSKNQTAQNLYAMNTTYYDYYYKNIMESWFYNDDPNDIYYYIYLANYWHGYAAYWTGLASNGGYN